MSFVLFFVVVLLFFLFFFPFVLFPSLSSLFLSFLLSSFLPLFLPLSPSSPSSLFSSHQALLPNYRTNGSAGTSTASKTDPTTRSSIHAPSPVVCLHSAPALKWWYTEYPRGSFAGALTALFAILRRRMPSRQISLGHSSSGGWDTYQG